MLEENRFVVLARPGKRLVTPRNVPIHGVVLVLEQHRGDFAREAIGVGVGRGLKLGWNWSRINWFEFGQIYGRRQPIQARGRIMKVAKHTFLEARREHNRS